MPTRVGASYHSSSASLSLVEAIARELQHEQEQEKEEESALEVPHAGWSLHTDTASTVMKLTKEAGGEKIEVSINTVEQDDTYVGEDAEEEEPDYSINFRVDCTKGGHTLRYTCSYVENDESPPGIEHVAMIPKGGYTMEQQITKYEGPTFAELDEGLQAAFAEHLAGLGIDANFGQYLCRLVYDKEQADYVSWLGKVHAWTKA
jgi:Mitochondrial glycoprotein